MRIKVFLLLAIVVCCPVMLTADEKAALNVDEVNRLLASKEVEDVREGLALVGGAEAERLDVETVRLVQQAAGSPNEDVARSALWVLWRLKLPGSEESFKAALVAERLDHRFYGASGLLRMAPKDRPTVQRALGTLVQIAYEAPSLVVEDPNAFHFARAADRQLTEIRAAVRDEPPAAPDVEALHRSGRTGDEIRAIYRAFMAEQIEWWKQNADRVAATLAEEDAVEQ